MCGTLHSTAEGPAKSVPPTPSSSFPLESFGYRPGASTAALRSGYINATLAFIDADHLLLTYTARKLMARAHDQRETDDDHTVRAEVIHLPDGKVMREAEWRMHDRAQYLWQLGGGRFLLRERGDLYALDPLGGAEKDGLNRRLLLHSDNEIETLQLSPARDLLLVETTPPRMVGDDPTEKRERPVSADFFRVVLESGGGVSLKERGHAMAHDAFSIAFTSMGVLQTVQEDRTHWGFDFHTFAGKNMELGGFTTTCRPSSIFVSDAEFFAFGCRGGEDRKLMGGFNLLAEAKWVFTTDDSPVWLGVSNAPAAGRFAVRNTLTTVTATENDRLSNDEIRAQEVRVYSSREGEELLRAYCSPAQRAGGNFALSEDGLKLAVLHGAQLEVYALPPVASLDRKLYEREQTALVPLRPSAEMDVGVALHNAREKPRAQ